MADAVTPTDTLARTSRWPHAMRAFRHRNFQLFYSGQAVSLIGTWMQLIAQSWLVYRLTGSSLLLGGVAFAEQFPIFLLAPLGGITADRYNRRMILLATTIGNMSLALILATLTLTNTVQVWHIFTLSVCLGVVNAFDMPTRQTFVVDMVGKEDLVNAIALNSSLFNAAVVVGPAVAGLMVARVGEGSCFLINGLSKISVIASLLLIKLDTMPVYGRGKSPLQNIVEGARWVKDTRPIRALFWMLGLVSLLGTPQAVLMPVFADRILHHGSTGLGILMGAHGAGALIAALSLAVRRHVKGLERWIIFGSAGLGLSMILFSISRIFWVSVPLRIPMGFSMMLQMAASLTLIQAMVPDQLRGRVVVFHLMMFVGTAPVGSFFAGLIAQQIGAPLTVALGGVGVLASSIFFGYKMRDLHAEAEQLILAQELTAGEPPEEVTAGALGEI
jgi:MFS family permease